MPSAITIDELIALNDEMAALVKAGVPLGRGLADVGEDVHGAVGRISRTLAERLAKGETLENVLANNGQQFPPLYAAMVEAGVRSGRLASALEELSGSLRRLAALRRLVAVAAIYPLIVFFVCYGMFLFFALRIAPVLLSAAPMKHPPAAVRAIAGIRDSVVWWGPILPAIIAAAAALWYFRSRRAVIIESDGAVRMFGWAPSFRKLLRDGRAAGFADMLAMLVEHDVPLAEAVRLAGRTAGDRELTAATNRLADELTSGGANTTAAANDARGCNGGIPPLLHWLIATGGRQAALTKALRDAADTYRRRALRRADRLRLRVPIILLVGVGGTVTLLYALGMFVPWTSMLYDLTKP